MLGRAVFDEPTLAADEAVFSGPIAALSVALRTLAATLAVSLSGLLGKGSGAINPVAHFLRPNFLPVLAPPFYGQDSCSLLAASWKANHLAVVVTARIWTATWKVVKDVFRWYEQRMRE